MLRIAIPKGSLEEGTFKLFELANLPIRRENSRGYNLFIDDPRISEVMMLRPQEIAKYVEEGEFDLGITGYDWILETEAVVKEVADLEFAKQGWRKVKIVLATDISNPINKPEDILPNSRVVTEYPRLTRRYFKKLGKAKISIRGSYGATEVKVPRLADYLVDVTETGETLRRNNKKILAVIIESSTKLIANFDSLKDSKKRQAIDEITTLLLGVIKARGRVLIKMNVLSQNIKQIVDYLPSLQSPTIFPLWPKNDNPREKWFMVETVVEEAKLNIILPKIKELGARDILEINISKMIP